MRRFLANHPYFFTTVYLLVIAGVYWWMLTGRGQPRFGPCMAALAGASGAYFWLCYKTLQLQTFDLGAAVNVSTFTFITLAALILCYATLYRIGGLHCTVEGFIANEKLDSLYFSGVTWTTVGYGDFVPKPGLSRFFAVVEAVHSYMFLAVYVSLLIHMLTHLKR